MFMKKKTEGLTMIEWLVVIAIIGIVIFAVMKFNSGEPPTTEMESTEYPMMEQPDEEGM